jgi:hypothetical protein
MDLINKELLNEAIELYKEFVKVNPLKIEINEAKNKNDIDILIEKNNQLELAIKAYETYLQTISGNAKQGLFKLWYDSLKLEQIQLWDKGTFELFFNNAKAILLNDVKSGELSIKKTYSVLLRLQDIYNERFKPETEGIDLQTSLSTATQKVQFMYELGIFDLLNNIPELNGNVTKISQVVSAFTGIKTDTIRQPYRAILDDKNISKYNISNSKNEDALNAVYNEIGLKRKVRIKGDTKGKM